MNKIFEKDSLLAFSNFDSFILFYRDLEIYDNWRISSGTMNSRGECIRDKRYTIKLQEKFNEKNMFRKNVSVAEIVSWLDSFVFIKRLFESLKSSINTRTFSQLNIYSEYVIKMSKKMRIDYIITFKDRILLIEIRLVSKFDKIKPAWEKKKIELLIYKELLSNYIPSNVKVITFALVLLPEWDIHTKIDKHIEYNYKQVNFLKQYILEYLISER